jgi:predicted ABC-type ATPase
MPPKKAPKESTSKSIGASDVIKGDVATTTLKRLAKTSSGRKSPDGAGAGAAAAAAAAAASTVEHRRVTQKSKTKGKSDDEDNPKTPNTPVLDEMIRTLEREQREGDGELKPWFETDFLLEVLRNRLNPPSERTPNPNPIFYVLIGPASSGKSSVRTQIPELRTGMERAINLDVDEIKLYGNDTLGDTVSKQGKSMKAIEGIQFKYNEVLAKLRNPVFEAATAFGPGQYKNIILDSTGSMRAVIKKYMTDAKRFGYTVKVIIVHSSEELCMTRVRSRNAQLTKQGHATRVIFPGIVRSIHETFVKKGFARYYATHPAVVSKTDELYCIDNNGASPIILAHKTAAAAGGEITVSRESPMVGVPGAFYGLTIAGAGAAGSSGSISGGKSRRRRQYTATRKNKNTMRRRIHHRTQRDRPWYS